MTVMLFPHQEEMVKTSYSTKITPIPNKNRITQQELIFVNLNGRSDLHAYLSR